ncbi:hypothetical protein RSW84_27175, partial [Escherichia coli]|uniref:hypothetical protein n=1 Tax=Escherichia coli TaxID=562 RepID=UPI0028DDAB88
YKANIRYAWENFLPAQLRKVKELGFQGPHYIDVFSATLPYYSCDKDRPLTREQAAEYQNKTLEYCHQIFGGAASEGGFDHVAGQL